MTTQIIWTALPNGFDANYYYFSVFVSHRLSGATTLQAYPLGPAVDPSNWAAFLAGGGPAGGFQMQASFDGGGFFLTAERLLLGMPRFWADLAPALWSQVFPPAMPVEDFVPQKPSARKIRSFSATSIVQQHETLYRALALNHGNDYPAVNDPSVIDYVTGLGSFPALLKGLSSPAAGFGAGAPAQSDQGFAGFTTFVRTFIANRAPAGATALAQQIAVDHYLAHRFYRRSNNSQYEARNAATVNAVAVPALTFHKLVGMLADHPTLLRNLGLVLDYRVPVSAFFNTPTGTPPPPTGRMQLKVSGPFSALVTNQYPLTAYRTTADGFYALESAPNDLKNGFLVLSANSYSVAQLDADGHAQKMIGYGITAAGWTFPAPSPISNGSVQRTGTTAPVAESLPARRTGGLTVLKQGRADALSKGVFAQGDNNNTKLAGNLPITLDSSDVCRGFRVDVWDANSGVTAAGGPWRSLCQRGGADMVGGTLFPLAPVDVEGFVKVAGASRGGPDSTADEQNTLYIHEALFGWDGWSLCARRPGRAIAHADGDANQHPVIGFLPNHAPAGYPIVSNYDVTPLSLPRLRFGRTYYFRARTVDLAGNGLPLSYLGTAVDPTTASAGATYLRYEPVAAPTLVLWRALTQGESVEALVIRSNPDPVDDLTKIVPGTNATAYAATPVGKTAGYLDHCDRHVAPPKTSQIMTETHGMLDNLTPAAAYNVAAKEAGTLFDSMVWNVDTAAFESLPAGELAFVPSPGPTPGDPPASGQYVLHQLSALTLPYLPDPLADGLAIQPAPGSATPPIVLPYVVDSAGWPRLQPIHLLVEESASAAATFTTMPGTFTIGLPPATLAVVRYSTTPSPIRFPTTVVGSQVASNPTAMNTALMGGNWLLSPYRELTLVHAVQRPLLIPSFTNASVYRGLGWTYVAFSSPTTVHVDGRSTVQIDVNAAWTDPIDDPANPKGPQTANHTGRAFSLHVNYTDTAIFIQPDAAGATALPLKRHEFGDTKHRWVTYSPDATTRYREYFPTTLTADSTQITTKGKTQILNVLSSRRPDPLKVLYALPSFQWVRSSDGSTVTRTGRAIRVYFDRPWFSSGDDELVGVLVAPNLTLLPSVQAAIDQYVSEWGRDPVWSSSAPATRLNPGHFTNSVTVTPQPAGVTPPAPSLSTGPFDLAEDASLSANVVAFKPEYNADRNLWFVDIEMDPGDSYFPFVRLALVRYQPHAVASPSQHLSRVARTEFLQLVPDRTAAIAYGLGRKLSVTVSGVGAHNQFAELTGTSPAMASPPSGAPATLAPGQVPSASPQPSVGGGHRVSAQVQQRDMGSSNDLLWKPSSDEIDLASYAEMGSVFWAASLSLPPADVALEFRLLIRENERYLSDQDVATGADGPLYYGERLVYAATFPLTVS